MNIQDDAMIIMLKELETYRNKVIELENEKIKLNNKIDQLQRSVAAYQSELEYKNKIENYKN